MKKYITIYLILLSCLMSYSKDLTVVSFELNERDITARSYPRVDNNGKSCALIKVLSPEKILSVQGNVIGDITNTGPEYNIYMTQGTKEAKIIFEESFPIHLIFSNYGIDFLQPSMTYILEIKESDGSKKSPLEMAIEAYNLEEYKKAFDLFSENNDDSLVQYYIAKIYCYGQGVDVDYEKSFEWVEKSIKKGNSKAKNLLAVMYLEGLGVEKDSNKALELLKAASEEGESLAQQNLGRIYYNGSIVPKDYSKAAELFTKAAEQGEALSQALLGSMYWMGLGVEPNNEMAVKWFTLAAEQDNEAGQAGLGQMYLSGLGVETDTEKAAYWFRKCAEKGNASGQYALGLMYLNGVGLEKNKDKAIHWFKKSASKGYTQAIKELENLGIK